MSQDLSRFSIILGRIRAGDESAMAELVRDYEPLIRRSIRLRIRDPRVRRVMDSVDICQSVMASFCVRASLGQYQLESPSQLVSLLVAMARKKLAHEVRSLKADRRDYRRVESFDSADAVAGRWNEETPSQLVARADLTEEFRRRLTNDERRLVELRNDGYSWGEIAEQLGGTPDSRRVQLSRAISRVADDLRLNQIA
jgi:RNA polymerase sigma factor (sigma-70 family)